MEEDAKRCMTNGIPNEVIIKARLECADVLENLITQIHKRPLFDENEGREYTTALRNAIAILRSRF